MHTSFSVREPSSHNWHHGFPHSFSSIYNVHINLVLVLLLLHGGIHAQPVGCLWVEHEQWAFHAASKNVPFRNGIIGWMEVSVDRRRWVGFTTSLWRLALGDCDFRCVVICQNNHSCVYPHRNCILNIYSLVLDVRYTYITIQNV